MITSIFLQLEAIWFQAAFRARYMSCLQNWCSEYSASSLLKT